MENDTKVQPSRKKPVSATNIVAVLLVAHGLFLIIIGLIAFFGGFVGAYDVSHGHVTPGATAAIVGAFLASIFLLEGIVSFLCAQGLLAWQRWAFWLTIALEVINLLFSGCALALRLFTPWPIVLSICVAAGILLYLLLATDLRKFHR